MGCRNNGPSEQWAVGIMTWPRYINILYPTGLAIDPNQYVTQQKITKSTNKLQFQTYSTTKDYFKYGFFPQTIRIWNSLPQYQPAFLCQTSPWISLKLWYKVTNSEIPFFSAQCICMLYFIFILRIYLVTQWRSCIKGSVSKCLQILSYKKIIFGLFCPNPDRLNSLIWLCFSLYPPR